MYATKNKIYIYFNYELTDKMGQKSDLIIKIGYYYKV